MNRHLFISAIFVLLTATGCNHINSVLEETKGKSAEDICKIGHRYLQNKKYKEAALVFEQVEKNFPYSHSLAEAQLYTGISHMNAKKYEDAIVALDSFIQLYPTHKDVPYALYLLMSVYFNKLPLVDRDQEETTKSLEFLQELCIRYPNSKYCTDAKKKLEIIMNQLALQEFRIGRYYQKKRNFTAAVSRYTVVIEHYPKTNVAQEAYLRLIECYLTLNLVHEAKAVYNALSNQYKNSKWYKYATSTIQPFMDNAYNSKQVQNEK